MKKQVHKTYWGPPKGHHVWVLNIQNFRGDKESVTGIPYINRNGIRPSERRQTHENPNSIISFIRHSELYQIIRTETQMHGCQGAVVVDGDLFPKIRRVIFAVTETF